MTFMRDLLIAIVLLALAACNTVETPTDLPFYTATPHLSESPGLPTESAIELPNFSSGDPQALNTDHHFQFTVSGDVSAAVTQGNIVYNYVAAVGNVSARDKIFISSSDATAVQQLAFEFSPGIGAGIQVLTSPANAFPGSVTAQYLRLSDDGTGDTRIQAYTENIEGTLILMKVGETISGAFDFTAQSVTASESGETVTRTVTVSGAFEDVPYSRLQDPFEPSETVPERSTPLPIVGGE
jgi:hypothetical protein